MFRRAAIVPIVAAALLAGCETYSVEPKGTPRPSPLGNLFSPAAPKGQEDDSYYTILLYTFNDLNHAESAELYRARMSDRVGWKDLFVITASGHSQLFWGHYKSIDQAKPNLTKAHAHRTGTGVSVFGGAMVVPMPGKDIGPPELNLKNVKAPYTLLVAVFQDDPDANPPYVGRKRFALEYCQQLRKAGYEAYYFHSQAASSVSIGAFGKESFTVRKVSRVGSGGPSEMADELVVNDPRIKTLQRDFPNLALNGNGVRLLSGYDAAGKEVASLRRTYIIRVPKEENDTMPDRDSRPPGENQARSGRPSQGSP